MKTKARPVRNQSGPENTCKGCSQSRVGRKEFKCFLVCGQRTDAYPSALSVAVLRAPPNFITLLSTLVLHCKSTNDAMIRPLFSKSRSLNSWRNSLDSKLGYRDEEGEVNQISYSE